MVPRLGAHDETWLRSRYQFTSLVMEKPSRGAIATPEQLNAEAFMDLILDGMDFVSVLGDLISMTARFQLTIVETLGLSGALERRFRIEA